MKLHIKSLALAILLAASGSQVNAAVVSLELMLMIDVSNSIDAGEFDTQISGYSNAFRSSGIQNTISALPQGMAVSVGFFATNAFEPMPAINWRMINDAAGANQLADEIDTLMDPDFEGTDDGKTNIAAAVEYGKDEIEDNGFTGTKKIIDVSSDGIQNVTKEGGALASCDAMSPSCIPDGGGLIETESDAAAGLGITVNAIFISGAEDLEGIGESLDALYEMELLPEEFLAGGENDIGPTPIDTTGAFEAYYERYVKTDDGFVLSSDFDGFEIAIAEKLQREIASAVPVPAAVWLFASALVGLVAKARIKRTTA